MQDAAGQGQPDHLYRRVRAPSHLKRRPALHREDHGERLGQPDRGSPEHRRHERPCFGHVQCLPEGSEAAEGGLRIFPDGAGMHGLRAHELHAAADDGGDRASLRLRGILPDAKIHEGDRCEAERFHPVGAAQRREGHAHHNKEGHTADQRRAAVRLQKLL